MDGVVGIGLVIMFLIVIIVLWWVRSKLSLDAANCADMDSQWSNFPLVHTISLTNPTYGYALRDYYIKTAYNCCAAGQYKNDFVNICALKDCIKQGVRGLDFAVYSVDNKPVIAISTNTDFSTKESYNSVPFETAMKVIQDYAFSGSTCPNPGDPLLLHFRIMSQNPEICGKMAKALYSTLETRLLDKKYSYEFNGQSLPAEPLLNFMGKVIIVVDKSNKIFAATPLDEYVNLASNSVFMRTLRFHDVRFTSDMNELMYFNKKNFSISLPDFSANNDNPSAQLPITYGVQMVGMSFQKLDTNLQYYVQQFDNAGSAFILKPEHLRYIPATIPVPDDPPPEYSYKTRVYSPLPGAPPSMALKV